MDENILKIADVSVSEYDEVIGTLKDKNMNFSRMLLSVNSKIAYIQIIPAPITPIRGVA